MSEATVYQTLQT